MRFLLSLMILLGSVVGQARAIKHLFETARTMGRGRTVVALHDGQEASLFNPAVLALSETVQLQMLKFDFVANNEVFETISDFTQITEFSINDKTLNIIKNRFGDPLYMRFQSFPLGFRYDNIELRLFGTGRLGSEIGDPYLLPIDFTADAVLGAQVSYAREVVPGIHAGLTMRNFMRMYAAGAMMPSDLVSFMDPNATNTALDGIVTMANGAGMDFDLGALWQAQDDLKVGLTITNLFAAAMFSDQDKFPDIPRGINVGVNWRTYWKQFTIDTYGEIQHLSDDRNGHFLQMIHLGAEAGGDFWDDDSEDMDYSIQLGVNDGYITAGAMADLYLFEFAIACYAAELGQSPGQKADQRLIMSLTSSYTF